MSLLVIGSLAYDTIETVAERREEVLGGSATHFAVAASHFAPPRLVGVVGEDFRKEHVEVLRSREIDLTGLEVAPGRTFRWAGRYEADWNTRHTLDTQLNVFETFQPKVPEGFRDSRLVFLANAAPRVQLDALGQVRRPRFVVADTMNLWIDVARGELDELLKRIDAIVLNDEEARMLTGERNLIRAAGQVLGMGPRFVILKKGEHGAFLISSEVHFSLPAYPVQEVLDPTGAGDSFAGGFMGFLAEAGELDPGSLRRAMLYGTVTASFCVEDFGIEALARCRRDAIDARYDELLRIVTV